MAKLYLSLEGNPVKEFRLTRHRTSIGRRSSNDIQIDNLAVSGEHAVLELVGQIYFIEDQKSTNGTSVNGEKIKRHPLRDGDEIKIGKYSIKFWREAAAEMTGTDFERTMILHAAPQAQVKTSAEPTAVVRVLTGANAGRELVLTKNVTTLGKAGLQVSVINRRGLDYFLAHVEGAKRPIVNGREIGESPHQLIEEDLIEILGIRMAFFYR
jgi:hypothetical protein